MLDFSTPFTLWVLVLDNILADIIIIIDIGNLLLEKQLCLTS